MSFILKSWTGISPLLVCDYQKFSKNKIKKFSQIEQQVHFLLHRPKHSHR